MLRVNSCLIYPCSDFVEHRAYTLAVTDLNEKPWQFVVKSWANGSEARRVYVLEQALLFLRTNQLREGDVVGICCDEQGNFQVAANTPELTEAVLRPSFGMTIPKRHAETFYGEPSVFSSISDTHPAILHVDFEFLFRQLCTGLGLNAGDGASM